MQNLEKNGGCGCIQMAPDDLLEKYLINIH
jgi:hypothetical protein